MVSPLIKKLATVSLVFIFLVILAGSVVRATGSGMGCPDWPQCFGYNIPPTDVETLTWREGKTFEEGQMILLEERFWVAKSDLVTDGVFNQENWTLFDRHEYTIFNPVHTWIEFINRLIGALSGLPILLMTLLAFVQVRKNVWNAVLSFGVLFLLGFEAWLGKLVVDGNLVPWAAHIAAALWREIYLASLGIIGSSVDGNLVPWAHISSSVDGNLVSLGLIGSSVEGNLAP